MYEVTVVYGARKGEVMWPGPEIIVMIGLGGKKSMQYVLLEGKECLIFKPLTLNKPFSLKLNDASGKYFTCFKIDTLIKNRVYYKVGQLQYLVRALKGK